ncbi:MAG: UPF0175 family protein [Lachnospiraceae bacterium]|nr:UPF0175 family protein [Lachnospiraceae bacterium]
MCQISVQIPEAVLYDTHMDEADASSFAKKMVALGYYTKNNVSIGYCSQIAEMPEEDFIRFLGENGISIFQYKDSDELLGELKNA